MSPGTSAVFVLAFAAGSWIVCTQDESLPGTCVKGAETEGVSIVGPVPSVSLMQHRVVGRKETMSEMIEETDQGSSEEDLAGLAEDSAKEGKTNSSFECRTRADPKATTSWLYRVAKPGTLCVFGADDRDLGRQCIWDQGDYGEYGWCYTNTDRTAWGSCDLGCEPLGVLDKAKEELKVAKERTKWFKGRLQVQKRLTERYANKLEDLLWLLGPFARAFQGQDPSTIQRSQAQVQPPDATMVSNTGGIGQPLSAAASMGEFHKFSAAPSPVPSFPSATLRDLPPLPSRPLTGSTPAPVPVFDVEDAQPTVMGTAAPGAPTPATLPTPAPAPALGTSAGSSAAVPMPTPLTWTWATAPQPMPSSAPTLPTPAPTPGPSFTTRPTTLPTGLPEGTVPETHSGSPFYSPGGAGPGGPAGGRATETDEETNNETSTNADQTEDDVLENYSLSPYYHPEEANTTSSPKTTTTNVTTTAGSSGPSGHFLPEDPLYEGTPSPSGPSGHFLPEDPLYEGTPSPAPTTGPSGPSGHLLPTDPLYEGNQSNKTGTELPPVIGMPPDSLPKGPGTNHTKENSTQEPAGNTTSQPFNQGSQDVMPVGNGTLKSLNESKSPFPPPSNAGNSSQEAGSVDNSTSKSLNESESPFPPPDNAGNNSKESLSPYYHPEVKNATVTDGSGTPDLPDNTTVNSSVGISHLPRINTSNHSLSPYYHPEEESPVTDTPSPTPAPGPRITTDRHGLTPWGSAAKLKKPAHRGHRHGKKHN